MKRPLYLAGKMSGCPQFNFPLFEEATVKLRARGHCVTSPHEEDSPEVQDAAWASPDGNIDVLNRITGETWGDMLGRDVKLIADEMKGIVLLSGWERSRGARLEAFVGLLCGHAFYEYVPDAPNGLLSLSEDYVREHLLP